MVTTHRLCSILIVSLLISGCLSTQRIPKPRFPNSVTEPASQYPLVSAEFQSFNDRVFFDAEFQTPESVREEESKPAQSTLDDSEVAVSKEGSTPKSLVSYPAATVKYCNRVARKLATVTPQGCLAIALRESRFRSVKGEPIFYTHFKAEEKSNPLGKVLVLGGVHGDELTSVSTVYLWAHTLKEFHSGLFDWKVVPLVNPDGFFQKTVSRTNANGVDLNRNLPTYQWNQLANRYWKRYAGGTERKFPGYRPASEPETEWLINEITEYRPDVIVTVHAPYNLVDFDAADRSSAPRRLGVLPGKSLGTFPGSLGRYAGEERNIPVITLELPHSWRMPPRAQINDIWDDLVVWLRQHINTHNIAGRSFNHCAQTPVAAGCI